MSQRKTISKKTLIGSAVIPLWVFAVQQVLQGAYYVGSTAAVIAVALFAAYEYLGIKQIPASADDLKDVSKELGEQAKDAVDELEASRSGGES